MLDDTLVVTAPHQMDAALSGNVCYLHSRINTTSLHQLDVENPGRWNRSLKLDGMCRTFQGFVCGDQGFFVLRDGLHALQIIVCQRLLDEFQVEGVCSP